MKHSLVIVPLLLATLCGTAAAQEQQADISKAPTPAVWIPFAVEHDIEPGSALDFSWIAAAHAPCGVHGRVVARGDHFEF